MASSDLLSQDEIDALLSGVDSGDVETEADEDVDEEGLRSYDFTSQDRIVRGRMPTLEMVNERFARNFRILLFNMLRRSPGISCEGIQMTKFGEYVHSLLMPSNLNICKISPLRGSSLLVFNPKLVFSLVDTFFGGDGKFHTKIEGRDFTGTEMRVVRSVIGMCFEALKEAWEPVMEVDFEYINSEVNPHFANIVSSSEVVVVSSFNVDLEPGGGILQVAIPYSTLEPIRELLDSGMQSDVAERDMRWSNLLQEEVKSANVTLNSRLTEIEVSLGDVMNMKAGDVIGFDMPSTVTGCVDDVPVFRATYGVTHGAMALKVVEPINHGQLMPREYEGVVQR